MNENEMFYHAVNMSVTYADNQKYIKQTSLLIDDVLKKKSLTNHLLILGAGNMNDLSLDFFLRKFERVTLTDIDVNSMEQHMKNNHKNPKISIKQMDYLGLSQSGFFEDLKDLLLNATSKDEVKSIVTSKIQNMLTYHFSPNFDQGFDVVYISPIYTQLFYRQLESYVSALGQEGFRKELMEESLSVALQEMIHVIDHFNKEVGKLVKTNGVVFIASDIFQLSNDSFSNQVRLAIESQHDIEKLHQEYQDTYGFGLGDYGLYSANTLLHLLKSKWFIWNQSKHQTYAVKFCAFEKIDE